MDRSRVPQTQRIVLVDDTRGQGLAEYIIIVILVAVGVIVGLRLFGGSLFGQFQNATHEIKTAGRADGAPVKAKEPGPAGSGAAGAGAGGEQAARSGSTGGDGDGSSSANGSANGKIEQVTSRSGELDKQVAELRTGIGQGEERVVDKIQIDWSTLGMIAGVVVAIGVYIVFRKTRQSKQPGEKKKKRRLFGRKRSGEEGQVLVLGLILCVGLMMAAVTVANVGMMVAEKIQLQDTVDAAAYSAAVSQARYMNMSAYVNRAMVANYDMMAFDTALWTVMDADDHGMAFIVSLLYQVDAVLIAFPLTTAFGVDFDQVIDALQDYVHHPLHTLNSKFNDIFAQDDDAQDINQYIELYNVDILSIYQGLLYAAMQASRYEIEREVAEKMDKDVRTTSLLGLAAETVSFDEMARSVDYVIRDPDKHPVSIFAEKFNDMAGKPENEDDNPLLLAAVTEASLDRFVAGKTRDGEDDFLRSFNFGHIIPFGAIEAALDFECNLEEIARAASPLALFTDPLNCNADINLILGANMRDGYENKANEDHVPFITRRRMREVNFFGIDFKVSGTDGVIGGLFDDAIEDLLGERGHTSGEIHNDIGNVANTTLFDLIFDRAVETFQYNNFKTCCLGLAGPPTCGLNSPNILEASTMIPVPLIPPIAVDDHWDGSFEDNEPVQSYQLIPPGVGNIEVVEYIANVASDGLEAGVPKYDWDTDLDNVGFPNFIYPNKGAQIRPAGTKGGDNNNLLVGPSIAVVGVKPQDKINNLYGLGIGNDYSMSAVARAQVYYVRNPNRPNEVPSLFNPHWVARLAPIDAEDTPILLKEGLPFIASVGVPIAPTH